MKRPRRQWPTNTSLRLTLSSCGIQFQSRTSQLRHAYLTICKALLTTTFDMYCTTDAAYLGSSLAKLTLTGISIDTLVTLSDLSRQTEPGTILINIIESRIFMRFFFSFFFFSEQQIRKSYTIDLH